MPPNIHGLVRSFSSVASRVQLFVTPWPAARQVSLSVINSQSLLKLMSIASVMPSNHLILCHPLLLPPSIFSSIGVFSSESVLSIKWPKYWSFSFSISLPMNVQDCSPRDSQESSPTAQFKSVSSLVFNQGCCSWTTEYGRGNSVGLLRLGLQGIVACTLSPKCSFWENSAPGHQVTRAALNRGPCGG